MPTTTLPGKGALTALPVSYYQVPAGKEPTVNIRVVNRDPANPVAIRLAVCPANWVAGSAPADADYIEPPDYVLQAGEVLEEIAVVMYEGEQVVASATPPKATIRVHGKID